MGGLDMGVLLNPKDLTEHFSELQNKAKSIRIAVAWATQGKAIDMLCNAKCQVASIVGTDFNATDPLAVEKLQKLGPVRVYEPNANSIFHPKLYLFQLDSRYEAIIGSPNLSDAAFSRNEEAAIRIALNGKGLQEILNYFEILRQNSKKVTGEWLRKYKLRYKAASKSRSIQKIEGPQPKQEGKHSDTTVGKLLTYSWDDYFDALVRLSDPDGDDRLFKDNSTDGSYLKTLDILRPIIRRKFRQIHGKEFRKLIGARETLPDSGWFGSLTANGRLVRQLEKRGKNGDILDFCGPRRSRSTPLMRPFRSVHCGFLLDRSPSSA